jgi:hypothetical protein
VSKVEEDVRQINGYTTHFVYDPESKNWGFRVPDLHIVGGDKTRSAAERTARDAIQFSLEDDDDRGRRRRGGWWSVALVLAAVAGALGYIARKGSVVLRELTPR